VRILSVNIGRSREVAIKGRPTQTAIDKTPVAGRLALHRLGLQGDVRVEPRKMGLEHHAVYAYPHEHYAYWQHELGRTPFLPGQFGENLTVSGLLEEEVRIGDVFRVGSAVLQVAQPRIPCAKLNERMGLRFAPMFLASRRVGYYLRVLKEGDVAAGDAVELLERDASSPTMEAFVRVSQYEYWDTQGLRQLLQSRDLMPAWRDILDAKLERSRSGKGWHGLREFVVVRRIEEGSDTVSLELQCARGRPLSAFEGGQHLAVVLGAHTAHQQRRSYAITSDPADRSRYRICVRRLPATADQLAGIVSSHLVSLKVGQRVMCAAPHGSLTLGQEHPGRIPVLLSQGLGIAAMLGLLYALQARQAAQAYLFHEADGPDPQHLMQELDALVRRNPGFHLFRLPAGSAGAPPVERQGRALTAAEIARRLPLAQADFFIVGTRSFADQLSRELEAAGVDPGTLKVQSLG